MFKRIASIALMTALFSTGVSAAMTISGTRIIFPGAEKKLMSERITVVKRLRLCRYGLMMVKLMVM